MEFSCDAIWFWAFVFWEIFDHSFNFSACYWVLRKVQSSKTKPGRNRNYESPITSTGIEVVIKNLPKNKSPGSDGFKGEFYQTFRDEVMPFLLKIFQKIAEEVNFQTNSIRPLSQ